MPRVFLHAPEDFHNLCLLSRTLESFGLTECFVFDPHALVRERYGKARARELRAVSSGAFEKIAWRKVDDPLAFLAETAGRKIATVVTDDAVPLERFAMRDDDVVVFGGEARGLPADVAARCDARVTLPQKGVTRSLNLVVALGIVLFEAHRQLAVGHAPPPAR